MNIAAEANIKGKPLNESPKKRPVKMLRWSIIVGLGLVLIVGAIVGFETFRANMIKQFFASNKPPPTSVNVAEAKSEVIPNLLTAVGDLAAVHQVNVISDVTGLHGQLQIRGHANKSRFHSTSVLTLNPTGNSGTWTGTGRWNGIAGYTFMISVVDNGTSGKKGDTISIVIKSPTNVVVFTTGGSQPLKGGNIVVH